MCLLKDTFIRLVQQYNQPLTAAEKLWREIEFHYTEKKRYYHTISHLDSLFVQLREIKQSLEDWDSILFALAYHDIIYKATKKNNEEKSAALAEQRLLAISFPADRITRCCNHILATKFHQGAGDNDTNLFTDADLSILGEEPVLYMAYCHQVRKEYAIYPDFLYKPGRKKVLQHFLAMDHIFKTPYFYNKYEQQARKNIAHELETQ